MARDQDNGRTTKKDEYEWKETVWNEVIEEITSDGRVGTSLQELLWVGLGDHPIDLVVVDQALQTKNWELGDGWDREAAGRALQFVQHDWVSRSRDLLSRAYEDLPHGLDIVAVAPTRIYIKDRRSEWQDRTIGGFVTPKIQEYLRYTHKLQAAADGAVDKTIIENEDVDIIVINKPEIWRTGEATARNEITYLIYNGLTPAEALDYWLVERLGISQSLWAEYWRNREQGTVSENVKKAEKKLRENQPELMNPENIDIPKSKIFP
jgi:hypothetical protein